jgi:peptidyl-prolyl cis-trans isomerase D
VYIPFTEISDSAVKVSDEDVQEYVNTHKDLFKQEAGRGLSYYSFSLAPSNEDSLAAKMQLEQLVSSFAADTNNTSFVAKNGSTIEFPNKCVPKAQSGSTMIDSIISRPLGSVYGPYFEASKSSYVIAKYIAVKSVPDSVKARHILIVTGDMNTGKQIRTDEEAKKQADSLLAAINAGSDFGSLAAQFSADGSKDKGGDLGTFGFGAMVPEFNDFCFYKSAGERGVVKTQFGYHVIEVQSQSNFNSAYNIAYINKEVFASEATVGQANLAATKASAIKDQKALTAYAAKNGLKIVTVPTTVKENDYLVGGLDDARQLVKWAFEAKKGDVSDPLNIGDQVIVAIVDKEFKEGTKDVATARPGCETIIRNKKKAEMIIKKTGEKPTLEAAAAAYNKQIMEAGADSSINFSAQIINNVGMEPKMIGAVLNKSLIGKTSPAFYGNSGVFVVKVNSIQSRPADSPEMARLQAEQKLSGLRGQTNGWYEGLKKLADIEDNRSNFY